MKALKEVDPRSSLPYRFQSVQLWVCAGPWDDLGGVEQLLLMEALKEIDPCVRLQQRPSRLRWTPQQQVVISCVCY